MVGSEFIDFVTKWNIPAYAGVEDFSDKWNFLFTPCILVLCTMVVTVKQYLLKPIVCFTSNKVTGTNYDSYMENFCWVDGTYPVPVDSKSHDDTDFWKRMESQRLLYYQWVPFILGLQTVMFYLPRLVWQMVITYRSGTDLQHLVNSAAEAAKADGEKREKVVKHIAGSLEHMLFMHREYRTGKLQSLKMRIFRAANLLVASKRLGTGLSIAYLAVKLLYLANSIGQIYLMQRFLRLGTNYTGYFGLQVLSDIAAGRDWEYTMVFPRVAFCRTNVAIFGGAQTYLSQCALPVNMLNEKIYIFLWFWFVIGSAITAASLPIWLCRIVNRRSRARFVRRFLRLMDDYDSEKRLVGEFVVEFLRHDGTFLLKMMQLNAGDIVTGDIVHELFRMWRDKHQGQDMRGPKASRAAAAAVSRDRRGAGCGDDELNYPVKIQLESGGTARRPGRSGKRQAPSAPIYMSPLKCSGDDVGSGMEKPLMLKDPDSGRSSSGEQQQQQQQQQQPPLTASFEHLRASGLPV
ncbi:hypothetical protein BOX15_Mlig024361g3 [Macrostomum lignano]|nr:hypothetical protein BOX15_Mlig024361g3 [Macrostomum lignano]